MDSRQQQALEYKHFETHEEQARKFPVRQHRVTMYRKNEAGQIVARTFELRDKDGRDTGVAIPDGWVDNPTALGLPETCPQNCHAHVEGGEEIIGQAVATPAETASPPGGEPANPSGRRARS